MRNIQEVLNLIGKLDYKYTDENGKALACIEPVYLVHPEGEHLKFNWVQDKENLREYILNLFEQHCKRISLNELQQGDIVTIKMPFGMYHVAVYLGDGNLLHHTKARGLEVVKMSLYEGRIERGYRY